VPGNGLLGLFVNLLKDQKFEVMKLFKVHWLYLLMVAFIILPSCDDDDDDDLVGDWQNVGAFRGYARTEAVSFVIGDYAYVGTGYNWTEKEDFRDFYRYDPSEKTWKRVAPLPAEAAARHAAVAFSAGGKGYVGSGYCKETEAKLKDFWEFDPNVGETGEWTRIADFPEEDSDEGRYGAVAFSLNGKGYVGTGYSGRRLNDFRKYDPSTGMWSSTRSDGGPLDIGGGSLRQDAVSFVIDNKAYVFTGTDNNFVTDAWVFDGETEVWTKLRSITSDTNDDESYDDDYNITCTNAVSFTMNGYGYITTGGKGVAGNKTWEYDPDTDFWVEKTEFEGSSRVGAVGFTVNDQGYVALGSSSVSYGTDFSDIWIFHPNAEQDDDNNGN
jgi:N-acetylneuraminic acid mutarotase